MIRPAVVDAHDERAAVGEIGHPRVARQRHRRMRRRDAVEIEDFAVCGAPAVEILAVPSGRGRWPGNAGCIPECRSGQRRCRGCRPGKRRRPWARPHRHRRHADLPKRRSAGRRRWSNLRAGCKIWRRHRSAQIYLLPRCTDPAASSPIHPAARYQTRAWSDCGENAWGPSIVNEPLQCPWRRPWQQHYRYCRR